MSWTPPSTPPAPPRPSAQTPSEHPEPLTMVPWSLWAATGLVALMLALVAAAGAVVALATSAGIDDGPLTALTAAVLSGSYLTVIVVVWLLARSMRVPFDDAVGMRSAPPGTIALGAVVATVVGRLAAGAWAALISLLGIEVPGMDADPTQLFAPGPAGVLATVIVAVILAPVAEEILYRGVVLSAAADRWGTRWGIGLSSAVFAASHVSPAAIVPIFVLSLVLGMLFVRTRSLVVCIVAHASFNAIGLALVYAAKAAGLL